MQILRCRGYVPLEAGSVGEAMRNLASRPGWILLDLMLPDGCGTQVLGRVRAENLGSYVCVITGCAAPTADELHDMGANHILRKPLDVDRLLSLLSAAPN